MNPNTRPPQLPLRFFRFFCNPSMAEDIEGDLVERFELRAERKGVQKARWLLARDVLLLFRPGIIRSFKRTQKLNQYDMFKNYFKVAYRNLWRHKSHSAINISGLAIGVAATLLMLFYVKYETGYDRFHEHSENIYRVGLHGKMQDSEFHQVYTTSMLASEMQSVFPEVKSAVRLQKVGNITLQLVSDSVNVKNYLENNGYFTDPGIFDVFSLRLLLGKGKEPLAVTNQIVLSESMAIRYFGDDWRQQDILGQSLNTNLSGSPISIQIAGVVEDLPDQSHFHFDFFMSNENIPSSKSTNWWNNGYFTYILLEEGTDPQALEAKLPELYKKNLPARAFEDGNEWWSFLQPLTDIHLRSNITGELEPNGNITYVYIFLITASLILIMACVNFVNLTVARASNRFKEMGIRKVIGSRRPQLILQHLIESQVYCLIAVILAVGIVFLSLPYFESFAKISIDTAQLNPGMLLAGLLAFSLLIGSIAGIYPALYLTRLSPVRAVKGAVTESGKKNLFRNGLITFQFIISIGIITGSLIISQQLDYIQNKQLGFEKEGVLVLENAYLLNTSYETFKTELAKNPGVISSATSLSVPTRRFSNVQFKPQDRDRMVMDFLFADEDFLNTYKIQIKEGRYFSTQFGADSSSMIINQALAENLGWKNPIGKKIELFGDPDLAHTIVGVMENFHHKSLHHDMEPVAILPSFSPQSFGVQYISLRIKNESIKNTMQYVADTWSEFSDAPVSYFFLDEGYNNLYRKETQTKQVFGFFSGLTATIAIIGLLGLVAHTTQQRRKEIGIRKVLGASVTQLIGMLSKSFLLIVLTSFAIMTPIVWIMMDNWLNSFSYHIDIPVFTFLIAGALALSVSLLVIGFQSLRSVMINPAVTLRSE